MAIQTLKKRAVFLNINKNGRKWVSKTVIVQTLENNFDQHRVGFTVSKKTSKKAVTRNRIKRRLRAASDQIIKDAPLPHKDFVLIGRRETEDAGFAALLRDLRWCIKRLQTDT